MEKGEAKPGSSKPAVLRSHGNVRAIQPKVSLKDLVGITLDRGRELSREAESVKLDVMHPERSAWLQGILEEVQSEDLLKRHFALSRFAVVNNRMLVTKGASMCAGFAAYVLERGVLTGIKKTLKAAQSKGDVYIFIGGSNVPMSKLGTCFRVLHGLIIDLRTAPFVCKAIPDLLAVLEASYYTAPDVVGNGLVEKLLSETAMKKSVADDKKHCLSVLLSLSNRLMDKDQSIIVSREAFLLQILEDYLANTSFSTTIRPILMGMFGSLTDTCCFRAKLFDYTLEAAFKTLEIAEEVNSIVNSLLIVKNLLLDRSSDFDASRVLGMVGGAWVTDSRIDSLLAVAACDSVDEQANWNAFVLLILTNATDSLRSLLKSGDLSKPGSMRSKQTLEELLEKRPKAAARRKRMCEIWAACPYQVHDLQPDLRARMASPGVSTLFEREQHDHTDKVIVEERGPTSDLQLPASRKCSREDCANTESKPCEFQTCGGCRLAVYCSVDCQKRAWKQGHKLHCRASKKGPKKTEAKSGPSV